MNSTLLGLEGVPKLAEELMVSRDIYLLEHTDSRLHFTNISTKKSVDLIRKAKKKGLNVSASVNVANLMFDDSEVLSYDTNFKVKPHLREQEDVIALLKGLADNTIDLIASGHIPLHIDEKKVEFENAEFGMSTIDCTFQAARTVTCEILDEEQLIDKFLKGYELLNQNRPSLAVGEKADYTVFQMDGTSEFQVTDIHSKGKNNPFVGKELMGAVIGVIKGNKTNIS